MAGSSVLYRALAFFVPVAMAFTLALGLIYAAVQQEYRSTANDPQYAMALDAAHRLDGGVPPRRVAAGELIDLAASYSPHLTVFNRAHRVLASTARLNGRVPAPPAGALDAAASGPSTITWQPSPGVRVAAVIVAWRGGTVLAGRSLALTEQRETNLEQLLGFGWLAGMAGIAAASLAAAWLWEGSVAPTPAGPAS